MMTEGTGFSAFAIFNALKLHFSSDSYDFLKYNGKTSVSKSKFETRKDKYTFCKLSRKYSMEDLKKFYISNFLEIDVKWIGEISNEVGEVNYKKWQKRTQSLTYHFESDIMSLFEKVSSPNDLLKIQQGNFPLLLQVLMEGGVCIETVCILNDIMNFIPMWDKKIDDDIIYPTWRRKIVKYTPFIDYDRKKFKSILKEALNEQT